MDHQSGVQDMDVELIFDFDGTITAEDTIASLAKVAVDFQVTNRKLPRKETTSAWTAIEKSYFQDLEEFQRTYVPPDGKSPQTPLDVLLARIWPVQRAETLSEVIADRLSGRQRRHVELASLARVKDEGLFRGIWPDYLFSAGQQHRLTSRVRLRDGFDTFVAGAKQYHDMHVLSVNWSDSWIRGVLSDYDMNSVLANSTNPEDGNIGATPGAFENSNNGEGLWPDILTVARDKLIVLRHLYWRQRSLKPNRNLHFVYFGDSTTDLECLMEVGGVIMSNDGGGSLLTMLHQELGYYVPHVSQWREDNFICWARDFAVLHPPSLPSMCYHKRVVFLCNHSSFGKITRKCFLQLAYENGECAAPCGKQNINPIQSIKVQVLCQECSTKVTDQVHKIAVIRRQIAEARAKLRISDHGGDKEVVDDEKVGEAETLSPVSISFSSELGTETTLS